MEIKGITGYPSIDRPWLKYYDEEAVCKPLAEYGIYEYLWENNKDYLEDVALNYYDRKITFRELFLKIEETAKAFSAIGISKGDIVIVAAVTIPETIYTFYALNRLGAISNMVDPRTSVEGIREYIKEVDAKYIMTMDVVYPKIELAMEGMSIKNVVLASAGDSLPNFKKIFYKISNRKKMSVKKNCLDWTTFIQKGKNVIPIYSSYKKDNCCVIVHTGGTTGIPKGVMLSDVNLNEMVTSFTYNGLSFDRGNVLLSIMPPFIAYGVVNGIHVVLCRGMQIVMVPAFDPSKLDELLLKYHPSHMLATPTHYEFLLSSKKVKNSTDLSFIKMVGIGGDGLHGDNENRLNEFFAKHNCKRGVIKGYGMTEVSAAACANRPEINVFGSVGLPFGKVIISAFEPGTDKELKIGEVGEICIYSPSTMLGYYGRDDETEKVLKKHSDGR